MQLNIRYKEVKVRRPNSGQFKGEEKFTGSVNYSVVGTMDHKEVRLSLGTDEKSAAVRRIRKIESAVADGSASPLWIELSESLPPTTFKFFADRIGYVSQGRKATAKSTWGDLCEVFELDMERKVANKLRGASSEEGIMSESTRSRYRQSVRHFTAFLGDENTPLDIINGGTIEKFKIDRHKKIIALKQSRGGASIALDVAVLHGMFALAISKQMMTRKPIDLSRESKPGKNPKNGARPFTGEELKKLREAAGEDLFMFLLLRWTGLRKSDVLSLKWENVHFERGVNGEIEKMTQKRSKLAIIPLSTELRNALEDLYRDQKRRQDDLVLLNSKDGKPFSDRKRMYERIKAMGARAGVKRVTPHCFRDTFACDMLARGTGIYEVAQMLADTVETVQKHYAQFVPASRDAVQVRMDTGIGIEEQAQIAQQRGKKVVKIRG
jgi:integrase/recombinase XerC/integrase/recombinase XerD